MDKSKPTWSQLSSYVRQHSAALYSERSTVARNFHFCRGGKGRDPNNVRVYALGRARAVDLPQTLIYVDLPPPYDGSKELQWKTAVDEETLKRAFRVSRAEELLQERMRLTSYGISNFDFDSENESFLWSLGGRLFRAELDYLTDTVSVSVLQLPPEVDNPLHASVSPLNSGLFAFCSDGDIYLQYGRLCRRVTFAKKKFDGEGFAGAPAFVYEEEFDRFVGFWWQPTMLHGKPGSYYLLYEETDERRVCTVSIGVPGASIDNIEHMKYPFAGKDNVVSTLRLLEVTLSPDTEYGESNYEQFNIQDLELLESLQVLFPWAEYLVRVGWLPTGQGVWAQIMSRLQDRTALLYIPTSFFVLSSSPRNFNQRQAAITVLYEETNKLVNYHEHVVFVESSRADQLTFIWLSEETGFAHLYLITSEIALDQTNAKVSGPNVVKKIALTSGDWPVSRKEQIYVDQKRGLVFFIGFADTPLESHLYVTSYKKPDQKVWRLTTKNLSHCLSDRTVSLSPGSEYFVDVCSSLTSATECVVYRLQHIDNGGLPTASVYVKLCSSKNPKSELSGSVESMNADSYSDLPNATFSFVKSDEYAPQVFKFNNSSGTTLYAALFHPPNFKPGVLYPTILYVYGGPNVQLVRNMMYGNRLGCKVLTDFGFCVCFVDNRGSDNRGLAFETSIKFSMGTLEVDDQVEGLMHVAKESGCIDLSRVACFGWSYGGYLSLLLLCKRPDVFKLAIAGAPVTDWLLYDTGYTERYMGLPDSVDGRQAYHNSSVITYTDRFPDESRRLLILHGLNDENVHFKHTSALISALARYGKPYELSIFPDSRHSIRGTTTDYFETTILHFLVQNL